MGSNPVTAQGRPKSAANEVVGLGPDDGGDVAGAEEPGNPHFAWLKSALSAAGMVLWTQQTEKLSSP